jgi:cytochrome c oxidase assembly factor CtaG
MSAGLLGHAGGGHDPFSVGSAPWIWTLDPLQLGAVVVAGAVYAARVGWLAERGRPVERWRIACFGGGLLLLLVALVSPVDSIGEERLLAVHMAQHLLIGDLAALLLVLGLTGPILRPVLALRPVRKLRLLAYPPVALVLWAANLYLWHLPGAYEAALEHDAVHALQHACFLAAGLAVWAAVFEPLPGPAWFGNGWKAAYVLAVRATGLVLANVFIWSDRSFYVHYDDVAPLWGLRPVDSQVAAGTLMMIEGSLVTLGVFAWFFLRWLSEGERAQGLVERGVRPEAAARAARYGRAP